jgi:hypothetical protein
MSGSARTYPCLPVFWRAEWVASSGASLHAEVLEASAAGIFVRTPPAILPEVQSRLRIRMLVSGSTQIIEVGGTVRRSGASLAHRCEGFALAFDTPSAIVAALIREEAFAYITALRRRA